MQSPGNPLQVPVSVEVWSNFQKTRSLSSHGICVAIQENNLSLYELQLLLEAFIK